MEEKLKKSNDKTLNVNDKLTWEAPRLFCLDKGRTEGGTAPALPEGTTYSGENS
ncbi:MAG: hypothetical protein KAQ75_00160 [Bacteroidales bacterium]|nr:hypothetical protein [Bacteroidales bacterium]